MNIYNDYLNTIKFAIAADSKSNNLRKFSDANENYIHKGIDLQNFVNTMPQKALLPSLKDFASEMGLQANFEQKLGSHPDFAYLKNSSKTENHYIISVFIDIKGSTNLFRYYDPKTVFVINNTIQTAAIHTCLIFGGYVHRLQGDGLFVYFGGKSIDIENASLRSLQSSSVFTYFVKNDLKNLFLEQGIENIYTRIGIDLGYDYDVIWGMAGIGDISEVTTCSLHTSLASKMQAFASNNGIVVGDNIKNSLVSYQDLMLPVCQRTQNENDRYIFRNQNNSFYYTEHDLDWVKFLKKQDFVATDLQGNLNIRRKVTGSYSPSTQSLGAIASQNKPYYFEV